MLSAEQLHHFKNLLTQSLKENEKQIEQNHHFGLHEEQNNVGLSGELSNYDNHPADSATELYEREKDLAIDDHYRDELDEIRAALVAIEKGTYGVCQVCQKEIPIDRLEAMPTATTCIEHSQQQNLNEYRPIEEEVINANVEVPHDDNNGFDEEDSWQSVAKWGNSDGPSDLYDAPTDYDKMYLNSGENVGYTEEFENSVGTDIDGKNIQIFDTKQLRAYEDALDEEGIMTTLGDIKAYEEEPYVDNQEDEQ